MQMKDVAEKLKDWKQYQLTPNVNIKDLIDLQLSLQKYYYANHNGKDNKTFMDYSNLDNISQDQKVQWTKQNILRIFDQIAEYVVWIQYFLRQNMSQSVKYNRTFELIDALHFLFNVTSIWQINDIKPLEDYVLTPSNDSIIFSTNLFIIASQMLNTFPWKNWKSKTPVEMEALKRFVNKFIEQVLSIFISLKMEKDDIYKMYFAKNKQNINRQKEGY